MPYRATLVSVVVIIASSLAPRPSHAATCQAEIERVERQLLRVSDPSKRKAIQALLDHARQAKGAGDANKCQADVAKARQALR